MIRSVTLILGLAILWTVIARAGIELRFDGRSRLTAAVSADRVDDLMTRRGRDDLPLHRSRVVTRVWYVGAERQELDPYQLASLSHGWSWTVVALDAARVNALSADVEPEWGCPVASRRPRVSLHVGR
jgi:hypothetical protein